MRKIIIAGVALASTALGTSMAYAEKSFTYWSMWTKKENQALVLADAIKDFERDTGIKVKVQWTGRSSTKKLAPTLNSPTSPVDLIDNSIGNTYSVLAKTNSHMDLTGVWNSKVTNESKTIRQVMIPSSYDAVKVKDGTRWMVPYNLVSSGWWYDAKNVPGLYGNEPKTWDEFIAFLKKRKSMGKHPIALDGDITSYKMFAFTEMLVRHLGSGNFRKMIEDKSGESLKNPLFLKAAKQYEQLASNNFFGTGYDSSKYPSQQTKWAQRDRDFIYNGMWIVNEVAKFAPADKDVKFMDMPKVSSSSYNSSLTMLFGFSIPKKAKNAEYAKQFIQYFMQKKYLDAYAVKSLSMTPRLDTKVDAQFKDLQAAVNASDSTHLFLDGVRMYHSGYYNKVLGPQVSDLVLGKINAEKFQEKMISESIKYWKFND